MPCFFISADAKLILVSRGVVAKTNLTHHYAGIRCGLINQRGVITAVLADSNIGVFSVPLVDGGIISETILSQFNSTIIRTLAYIGAVTIPLWVMVVSDLRASLCRASAALAEPY
ncbi:hypothetical protein Senen02_01178 [Salmonella enterica subsp. enterica]